MNKTEIKKALKEKCNKLIADRIARFQNSLSEAQEAANLSTSSSAGDKYNTDRALMHIERDKFAAKLSEAHLLVKTMKLIKADKISDCIDLGSLAETDRGNYFISVGLGLIEIDGYAAFAVSAASPIGQQLKDKKAKDTFILNGKTFTIRHVY